MEAFMESTNTLRSREQTHCYNVFHQIIGEDELRAAFGAIVGDSPALNSTLDLASIVAPTDSSVLILGETGTGTRIYHELQN